MTVKLFYRSFLKPVCNVVRSYHIKTLFYHFMDSQNTNSIHRLETATMINVEELTQEFLEFLEAQLEKGDCKHFFIDPVNLWDFQEDSSATKELKICAQTINNFLRKHKSSNALVRNIFCRNFNSTSH